MCLSVGSSSFGLPKNVAVLGGPEGRASEARKKILAKIVDHSTRSGREINFSANMKDAPSYRQATIFFLNVLPIRWVLQHCRV